MFFEEFELDHRLLEGISSMGFKQTTLVQETAIPLFLKGKDILAKARTGSGKTMAYSIPLLQKILSSTNVDKEVNCCALVLVPTKELASQVTNEIQKLAAFSNIKAVNLLENQPHAHVYVSTPSKARSLLESGLQINDMETLVIDESDLILSYGYNEDIDAILKHLPKIYQTFLASATLSDDVEKLKSLVLNDPAILKLEDVQENILTQYYIHCTEQDKFLYLLFMLKLKVHPFGSRKTMIFVNSVDKCYKVKLFLEQFGIKSCALNSALPVKSRYHIVQEFNRGVYDYIVATDESNEDKGIIQDSDDDEVEEEPNGNSKEIDTVSETPIKKSKNKKSRKKVNQDADYGVSRGIDFQNVQAVINFDMPLTSRNYQHRVGRTARGIGSKGYALTFCLPDEKKIVHTKKKLKAPKVKAKMTEREVLGRIEKREKATGRELIEFKFDMEPVERFRYRSEDAYRAVSVGLVREARIKELKTEILNSEKLKTHFEDNPQDAKVLRHDGVVLPTKIQPHMKNVPSYLLPTSSAGNGRVEVKEGDKTKFVGFKFEKKSKRPKKFKKVVGKGAKRRSDPLRSFSYKK